VTLIDTIRAERFLAFDVQLEPIGSPTFQVTTFANTGPSFYIDSSGRLSAVVDSVASVANQLEATVWDEPAGAPAPALAGLPWVRVVDADGALYTTSRTAAHRLNAHAIVHANGGEVGKQIGERLGVPSPPIAPHLAAVAWEFDPLAILHGLWWAGIPGPGGQAAWGGRARLSRALSGRIDAHGVQTQAVQVGGQKTADHLAEVGVSQARDAEGKTVEGEVPAFLSEVSAEEIVGRLLLDVRLIRSYGLGDERERALIAVALLEIGEMLDAWPRRRSRCALDVSDPVTARRATRPDGWELPPTDELRTACEEACAAVAAPEERRPWTVQYKPKAKAKS
jgi:CRISPR-associated protein Csb1